VYVHDPHCRGQRELTRGVCQSAACQRGHWKQHKVHCRENGQWFDKYRAVLEDGSTHFGDLELITGRWTHEYGDEIGWANAFLRDVDELRAKFETTFHGSEEWFFVYRRQAFRWTCCGQDAYTKRGCDHHGPGPKPCSCDFCMFVIPLYVDCLDRSNSPLIEWASLFRQSCTRTRKALLWASRSLVARIPGMP
jgi:hypothetical protein